MPLEIYRYNNGRMWWARGRVELDGKPISGYYRCSTGSPTEAGARAWCREEERRVTHRHLTGEEPQITFAEAVMLYPAKPKEAGFLLRVLDHLGPVPVGQITPKMVRDIAPAIYPDASVLTWKRQVASPVSAVINHAHDLGKCPPIRIKGWSTAEKIAQDRKRGSTGRKPAEPGDRQWIAKFCAAADPWNAALAEFMFETGARIGQALALEPGDLDLGRRRVWLASQKGHEAQWVTISTAMVVTLANLKPRAPHDRRRGHFLAPRVFGYASRSAVRKAWVKICAAAEIDYRSPHAAGRHGFYTELRVRQNLPAHEVAAAGRWSGTALPERVYGHAAIDEAALRERASIKPVYDDTESAANYLKGKAKS